MAMGNSYGQYLSTSVQQTLMETQLSKSSASAGGVKRREMAKEATPQSVSGTWQRQQKRKGRKPAARRIKISSSNFLHSNVSSVLLYHEH